MNYERFSLHSQDCLRINLTEDSAIYSLRVFSALLYRRFIRIEFRISSGRRFLLMSVTGTFRALSAAKQTRKISVETICTIVTMILVHPGEGGSFFIGGRRQRGAHAYTHTHTHTHTQRMQFTLGRYASTLGRYARKHACTRTYTRRCILLQRGNIRDLLPFFTLFLDTTPNRETFSTFPIAMHLHINDKFNVD